jgi:hypothetical protein
MHLREIQKELKTLHSIFLANEKQVFQLEKREKILKEELGGVLNG